jgi:4-hydroxy-3-methylbut-2-enyl diphosphate reductase
LGSVPVYRIGMGPARAAAAAARLEKHPPRAIVLAGVCGAVRTGAGAGQVIVATEIGSERGRVETTGAESLALALRLAGYTVHCGAMWTASRVVRGPGRKRLADRGVLGVDMESFPLACLGVPFVAVRSIVDTPEKGLMHPAALVNGPAALRALRGFGPALLAWSARVPAEPGQTTAPGSRTTEY